MKNTPYSNTEIPLIPGELYGMRGFKTNSDGTLSPLHRAQSYRYTSGIHTAQCKLTGAWDMRIGGSTFKFTIPEEFGTLHDETTVPSLDCSCGFYAYFDSPSSTPFMLGGADHINGIVRATGRCIVGSEGFRAENIEIVGLVCDYSTVRPRRERFKDFMNEILMGMAKLPFKVYLIFFGLHWSLMIASLFLEGRPYIDFPFLCTQTFMYCFLGVQFACLLFMITFRTNSALILPSKPDRELSKKIKQQFPNAVFFSNLEQAKEHFPLSKASDLPQ